MHSDSIQLHLDLSASPPESSSGHLWHMVHSVSVGFQGWLGRSSMSGSQRQPPVNKEEEIGGKICKLLHLSVGNSWQHLRMNSALVDCSSNSLFDVFFY